MTVRMKVSSSWDALSETLEKLSGKRMYLEKLKIIDPKTKYT